MTEMIELDGLRIELTRKQIKNLILRVRPDGTVAVSAPLRCSAGEIARFLQAKRPWLESTLQKLNDRAAPACRYETGDTVHLWGEPLTLLVRTGTRSSARLCGRMIYLSVPPGTGEAEREAVLDALYRRQLKERVEARLPLLQKRTGLRCNGWTIRKMTSRWGSCSMPKATLSINLRLAHKPPECLDAVLLHELTHTVYPNHGPAFWQLLDRLCPDRARCDELLKDHSTDI